MKCKALTLVSALLASSALARDVVPATSLPLTSVGSALSWAVGDQDFELVVRASGAVRLDLYSPSVDPRDYRSATYYGDETYAPGAVASTFTLRDEAGTVVRQMTFAPGEHRWESLVDGTLAPGTYRLAVSTAGQGKNTFAVKLTAQDATLRAAELNVNVRSTEWVPALRLTSDGRPATLRMYDGDGATELEAALRGPDGILTPMPVSEQLAWRDVPLPPVAGEYEVVLRQPRGARQYSNTVAFSLVVDGRPAPLVVADGYTLGDVRVTARLILPEGLPARPASATVVLGNRQVTSGADVRLPAATYAATPVEQTGASVEAPASVTVTRGGLTEIPVQVRPQADLTLNADRAELRVGEVVTLDASALTAFAADLPGTLTLDLPDGLISQGDTSREVEFRADAAARLTVRATATRPGDHVVRARLVPWGLTREVTLRVQAAETAVTSPAPVAPAPTPELEIRRVSTVALPFRAPEQATSLVVAHVPPAGGTVEPGSSAVDGRSVPDPLVGSDGTLYWTLDAATEGRLTYRVAHEGPLGPLAAPSLLARFRGDRREVLSGTLDPAGLEAARPLGTRHATENGGAVRLPLDGTIVRDRDRTTVVVVRPLGSEAPLTVNGEAAPDTLVGERAVDRVAGTERVTYYGVKLRTGENVLRLGPDAARVFVPGATARVDVAPVSLIADGSTPVRVRLSAFDAAGIPGAQTHLTVRSSIEPARPDADPQAGGYQVRLVDGTGVLELPPQATPTRLTVEVLVGEDVRVHSLDITPQPSTLGLGHASVTLGGTPFGLNAWRASAYYEGMLGTGKLYAAADSDGLPAESTASTRYPLYGDASAESAVLRGLDPVAFRYVHPQFEAHYRAAPVPVDVFGVSPMTALAVTTRGDLRVAGFAALLPTDRVEETLRPDGTRLLHLGRVPVSRGSDVVERVTRERGTGREVRRELLRRGADYVLDEASGVLTLTRPEQPVDAQLDDVELRVTYRTDAPMTNRALAWGAQVTRDGGPVTAAVGVVSMDGKTTSGARVTVETSEVRATARLAWAGGVQFGAEAAVKLALGSLSGSLGYREPTYDGLQPTAPGLHGRVGYDARLSTALSVRADADYAAGSGSVGGRVQYQTAPWTFGVGLRSGFGSQAGLSAVTNVGYREGGLDATVTHTHGLTTGRANSAFAVRYALAPNVGLTLRDDVDWQTGHRASVLLDSKLGGANLSAAYELPGASGSGNRARFGAETTLPLNSHLGLGLNGTYLHDLRDGTSQTSAGASLRYTDTNLSATFGTDLSLRAGVLKTVLRGGVTGTIDDRLTLTADGTSELGLTPGNRFTIGAADRTPEWATLAFARYQDGSLSGGRPEFTAALTTEYHRALWALRGGAGARFLPGDPESLTVQGGIGGTWYVAERFGLGLRGDVQHQPSTGLTQAGFGLEGSLRLLPGAWITVGFNPVGFDSIGNTFTRSGFYLRFDVTLDEQTGRR